MLEFYAPSGVERPVDAWMEQERELHRLSIGMTVVNATEARRVGFADPIRVGVGCWLSEPPADSLACLEIRHPRRRLPDGQDRRGGLRAQHDWPDPWLGEPVQTRAITSAQRDGDWLRFEAPAGTPVRRQCAPERVTARAGTLRDRAGARIGTVKARVELDRGAGEPAGTIGSPSGVTGVARPGRGDRTCPGRKQPGRV